MEGDVAESVGKLKEQQVKDIGIFGCGRLVQSLMPHNLIDTYLLMIHPIVLGTGRRLFPADGPRVDLRLVDSVATTTTGVMIGSYEPR